MIIQNVCLVQSALSLLVEIGSKLQRNVRSVRRPHYRLGSSRAPRCAATPGIGGYAKSPLDFAEIRYSRFGKNALLRVCHRGYGGHLGPSRRSKETELAFRIGKRLECVAPRGKCDFLVSHRLTLRVFEDIGEAWRGRCKRKHKRVVERIPVNLDIDRSVIA